MKRQLQTKRELQSMILGYDDELRNAKRKQVVDFQYVRQLAKERTAIAEKLEARAA